MTVYEVDLFPKDNVPEVREEEEELGESGLRGDRGDGEVIDFERGGEVADPFAGGVVVRDYDYLG